ncbi:MAG TPA: hypothetical protein VKH82_09820 [Candidatus Binatia bacterium]|nr:hypothetical protein [Candidatus Binatia bacterium]
MGRPAAPPATRLLSALVPLVATLVAWWSLPDTYFFADDFVHLFDLVTLPLPRFLTQIWAGHLSLVPNTVFAGMYAAFGPDPRPWFWSVLLTHALNVLLLHRVILSLTSDELLACMGATVWGTTPALEGALGWYSVYGQVLLTTLVCVVLWSLVGVIATGRTVPVTRAFAWGGLLAAGAACFGTGLGIAAVFPVVLLAALEPRQRSVRAATVVALTAATTFAIYAVLWNRTLDLEPRVRELMSSASILAATPTVLALAAALLGFSASTLFLGPLDLDAGYPDATTLGAAALVVAIVIAGWLTADAPRRRRLLWLAVLVVAASATIAAGRATILASWKVSIARSAGWPRYHYLLLALVTALLCLALAALRAGGRAPRVLVTGGAAIWLAARLVLLVVRPHAINHHEAERAETTRVVQMVRQAVDATPPGDTVTIQNRPFGPARLGRLFPGLAGVFVITFPSNTVDGRPVRFVGGDADDALARQRGGRIAALLPPP